MDGEPHFFQGAQQPLQPIGEGDGGGGIGQQEGAGDEHEDPRHHEAGPPDALYLSLIHI